MEPLFIFFTILVVYCGYLTVCDVLRIEKRIVIHALTELQVMERAGRLVLVLLRRNLAVTRNTDAAHLNLTSISRSAA